MPQLEEVESYIRGLWMLFRGNAEGFRWLDISARGFWRSFWAIAYCVPPIILSWIAFRSSYLGLLPVGAPVADLFYFKLLVIELAGWFVPCAALIALSQLTGNGAMAVPLVIATNWLSVPLQWLYAVDNAIQLLFPDGEGLAAILFLALLSLSLIAHYRIMSRIMPNDKLMPAAFVMVLFVVSYYSQYQLMKVTGLWLS